jgi:hypothetical protein
MNFTTKALVAAIALAGASSAHATLQLSSSGNGSIVLAVWDDVRQVSYVRDLGINYNDFLPAVQALRTFATDDLFTQTFGESVQGNIRWGVAGGERSGQANLAITRRVGEGPVATNNNALNAIGANMDTVMNSANVNLAAGFTSYATDSTLFNIGRSVNSGRFLGGAAFAGTWFGGIGEHLAFHNYRGHATSNTLAGTTQTYNALFTLTADGTLHYVPVPAAVWLLGSALVGMAGVARRRAA